MSLFLSLPLMYTYMLKLPFDQKLPYIYASSLTYYINSSYAIACVIYMYYEKYVENNCIFLFSEVKKNSLKTIGIRSHINKKYPVYHVAFYDNQKPDRVSLFYLIFI
jgi:hypothetical protein